MPLQELSHRQPATLVTGIPNRLEQKILFSGITGKTRFIDKERNRGNPLRQAQKGRGVRFPFPARRGRGQGMGFTPFYPAILKAFFK